MDLYISVVIATPMILLMILMMVSITGIGGFSTQTLGVAIIGAVVIVNILFLTFLHMKQPAY